MRLHYIFFLTILLGLNAYSQERELALTIGEHRLETVQLNNHISEQLLQFSGAAADDAFGMLPVYIKRLVLDSDKFSITAVIRDAQSELIAFDPDLPPLDIDKIGHDFQIRSQVLYVAGKPYAELILMPYRLAGDGQIEALQSCILDVDLNPVSHTGRALTSAFTENSVLAEGEWYRLAVDSTGIYKLGFNELEAMGVSVSALNPKKIRVFGNGSGIVPEKNSDERYDDLLQNPCYVHGEEDGSFDNGDYILFYGESSVQWNYVPFTGYSIFQHQVNPYDDHTYYYLNISDEDGMRVTAEDNSSLVPTRYVDAFTDYAVHENDAVNILKTGRQWYGELYSEQTVYEYEFHFPNIVKDYRLSLSTNVAAHSVEQSRFDYFYGDQFLLDVPVSKIIEGTTVYAWTATPDTLGFYPEDDHVVLRVEYDRPTSTSLGWMNYIALNARRELRFAGSMMPFRDHLSFGPGEVAEYTIAGAGANLVVWDVSDPAAITKQYGSLLGSNFVFRAPAEDIREFIAFDGSSFLSPRFIEKIENQNLHAYDPVDYVILSHPDFMEQAERMLMLHRQVSGLSGFIVTPQEVYNEFSSGKQDPGAIRDFVRMLYERADDNAKPKYLLLLGDASYDYKDRIPNNTNFIPTYQSVEALKLGYSFVTDDYFALFDPGEGVNAYGKSLEIGIGRFPVHTVEQAEQMVDKVEAYMTLKPNVLADWRNNVYFIADDEDQNLHFNQAEKLQYMLDTGCHVYNRKKIYLDAFPQVSSASGTRYPEVNIAIDRMMDHGSLIVNYTGHGGEGGWTTEKVLDIPTINKWTNWDRLPLYITATCEFSRFDDPSIISAGECVFLNPVGGGIGLLTTSRLAWADPNFRLNKAVYEFMFEQNEEGEHYRIGDVVRLAKTDQNNGTNIKNFVLLGDPAMQLAYPEYQVETTIINGRDVSLPGTDTLTAMSYVSVGGIVTDHTGDTMHSFNGYLYPTVYDKDVKMYTLGNDAGSLPAFFYELGPKLYAGRVSVANGLFSFSFFMPQNLLPKVDKCKFSYYAYDTLTLADAHGYYRVRAGGVDPDPEPDNTGPEMSLYLNSTDFKSGGFTNSDPVFLAYLSDEHGINHTGNGIGRDITLMLDHDPDNTFILNDLFEPDLDSYTGGWLSFPLSDLEDGKHIITLKAWDNMNNASVKEIAFEVNAGGQIALTQLINYPNPFTDQTNFVFKHNKPGSSFNVEVRIFSVTGQHVRTLQQRSTAEGSSVSPLRWDGTDAAGNRLMNGVYIYRVFVSDDAGNQYVQSSKLIYSGDR